MNAKVSSTLDKVGQDRSRSHFEKALSRLEDGIKKHPKELRLYTEAVDVAMESGESLKALQFFKQAQKRLPDDMFELWTFAADKVGMYNDPIIGRYLVEQAIKNGEVATASSLLADLKDHTADELLQRVRTKKQAMSSAVGGGFAARDEIILYAITEALLCIRLSRFPEAMDGMIRILDEKPYAHKLLEPFLVELEKQHREKGEAAFALGCCYMAAEKNGVGLEKLIHATKMTPSLMADAIARIESLGDQAGIPIDTRELRLAELYLAHDNIGRTEELLRGIIERDPAKASGVIELLEKNVQEIRDDLRLQFLFIDAALGLGRRDTAIGHLKKIFQKQNIRKDLLAWLEEKTQIPGTASEILLFFGESALTEGMHGRAIEIFKEILSHSVQEEPTIKALLSRHNSVPIIRHYYNDRFGGAAIREKASNTAFETDDDLDLANKNPGGAPTLQPATGIQQVVSKVDVEEFSFENQKTEKSQESAAFDLGFENHDFTLVDQPGDGVDVNQPERTATTPYTEPARRDDDFSDYLNRDFTEAEYNEDSDPVADDTQTDDVAADDFATADDVPSNEAPTNFAAANEPLDESSDFDFAPRDEIAELSPEDPPGSDEDSPGFDDDPKDFESLYQLFSEDRLDNAGALALIEQALDTGRLEEMKTVLAFTPANIGEDMARKHFLAEYYLETDQPLSALITLKTVNINGLSKDQRIECFTRIAVCYRALHNFEAAHSVFLRLLIEQPGSADIERMAEFNYEQYLQSVTGAAPTLEKVSSL